MTVGEIAEKLKLDKSTVSRALNHRPGRMSAETRETILRFAAASGYVPNPAARALNQGRTGNIGLISKEFNNALYATLLLDLAIAVDEQGGNLVTCVTARHDQHHGQEHLLHTAAVDGIFAFPYALPGLDAADSPWMRQPIVFLLPDPNGTVGAPPIAVPAVGFDDSGGVAQVVAHLRQLGHTALLYLDGLGTQGEASRISEGRLKYLRAAWTEADGGVVLRQAAEATAQGGHLAATTAIQEARVRADRAFTAIFAYNDQMARGAAAALWEHGIAVPAQVSLVGWNDLDQSGRYDVPPLTTIAAPTRALARSALELLNLQIQDPTCKASLASRPRQIEVQLIARASTGPVLRGGSQ